MLYGSPSKFSTGVSLHDIGLWAISVPVKLVNLVQEGKTLSWYVVRGFHGVHSSEDGKQRPVMNLAIYESREKQSGSNINKQDKRCSTSWFYQEPPDFDTFILTKYLPIS